MSIPGTKTLLMGGAGTGKTYCIRTYIEAGIKPFCLFFEPRYGCLGDTPAEALAWNYLPPTDADWGVFEDMAKKVNTLPFKTLTEVVDTNRREHDQLVKVYQTFHNFVDQRTGEAFGDVSSWGTDRVLCIDGLTGLSNCAMSLVVGGKPVRDQKDWGLAQNMLEQLLIKLTSNLRCHLLLIGHVEREMIEGQGVLLTISSLGKALPPKIPRLFDDVILTLRTGAEYSWSNGGTGIDTKPGYLPLKEKHPPSFRPLIESWKKAGGVVG